MKAKIAVFESHKKALEAIEQLKAAEFPLQKVSLTGKAEMINDHIHVKSIMPLKSAPLAIGAVAGIVAGILTGVGVFLIPGFGFLYGAGAIIGALAGLDAGIISGGLVTVLLNVGIEKDEIIKYEEHLNEGKYLLIVQGSVDEINKADEILSAEGAPVLIG